MTNAIWIHGDSVVLKELQAEMHCAGLEAGILTRSAHGSGLDAAIRILEITATAAAVWDFLAVYLQARRGKVSVWIGDTKFEAEGKTAEDAARLLKAGVMTFKRVIGSKKKPKRKKPAKHRTASRR